MRESSTVPVRSPVAKTGATTDGDSFHVTKTTCSWLSPWLPERWLGSMSRGAQGSFWAHAPYLLVDLLLALPVAALAVGLVCVVGHRLSLRSGSGAALGTWEPVARAARHHDRADGALHTARNRSSGRPQRTRSAVRQPPRCHGSARNGPSRSAQLRVYPGATDRNRDPGAGNGWSRCVLANPEGAVAFLVAAEGQARQPDGPAATVARRLATTWSTWPPPVGRPSSTGITSTR